MRLHRTLASVTLLAAVALAGCALRPPADPAGPGRDFDDSYVARIQKGVTSKEDILRSLGEPVSRATSQGTEIWVYRHERRAGSGADAKALEKKNLTIVFTGDRVQDVTYAR